MSLTTDLTRLATAKANIANAIAGKGVTVPEGTLVSGMASLIGNIQQFKFAQGSTTSPPSAILLGFAPKFFLARWRRSDNTNRGTLIIWAADITPFYGSSGHFVRYSIDNPSGSPPSQGSWAPAAYDATSFTPGTQDMAGAGSGTGTLYWVVVGW